jgi:hypothetical protein
MASGEDEEAHIARREAQAIQGAADLCQVGAGPDGSLENVEPDNGRRMPIRGKVDTEGDVRLPTVQSQT